MSKKKTAPKAAGRKPRKPSNAGRPRDIDRKAVEGDSPLKAAFRTRIRELRKFKGLSQQEVGEGTGLGQSFYSQLEVGRKTPGIETIEKLAKFFGVSPPDLLSK